MSSPCGNTREHMAVFHIEVNVYDYLETSDVSRFAILKENKQYTENDVNISLYPIRV